MTKRLIFPALILSLLIIKSRLVPAQVITDQAIVDGVWLCEYQYEGTETHDMKVTMAFCSSTHTVEQTIEANGETQLANNYDFFLFEQGALLVLMPEDAEAIRNSLEWNGANSFAVVDQFTGRKLIFNRIVDGADND
jgi:hypothetical protein